MKPQQLVSSLEALDAMTGIEALCCFVVEDERPLSGATGYLDWRLCGGLSKILGSGFFVGAPGDKLLVPTDSRVPARKVFAVGLGRSNAVTALGLEHANPDDHVDGDQEQRDDQQHEPSHDTLP